MENLRGYSIRAWVAGIITRVAIIAGLALLLSGCDIVTVYRPAPVVYQRPSPLYYYPPTYYRYEPHRYYHRYPYYYHHPHARPWRY
jgi:hypothetical protein